MPVFCCFYCYLLPILTSKKFFPLLLGRNASPLEPLCWKTFWKHSGYYFRRSNGFAPSDDRLAAGRHAFSIYFAAPIIGEVSFQGGNVAVNSVLGLFS